MVSYSSSVPKLVTFARSSSSSSLNLTADSKPHFLQLERWLFGKIDDRMLLKIVSSVGAFHFWFLLCPHNLRPLLRSRALIWAWSLLSTCSVINLMNKHRDISFIQSTFNCLTRRRRDLFLLGDVPDMPTGSPNGRFLLDLPALAFCDQRPLPWFASPLLFIYWQRPTLKIPILTFNQASQAQNFRDKFLWEEALFHVQISK